jgi:hypothetical protein
VTYRVHCEGHRRRRRKTQRWRLGMTIFEAHFRNGTLDDFNRPPGYFRITSIDKNAGTITFSEETEPVARL